MLVTDGDKVCVHKQNADKTAGDSLHCYTGADAEAQAKKYMAALYANTKHEMAIGFLGTELSSGIDETIHSSIDGLAARDDIPFLSAGGYEVEIKTNELDAYYNHSLEIIESTRTEKGEIVGLPIDKDKHDHAGGAGWIVGMEMDKTRNIIKFIVKWTKEGADLVRGNIRRFFSPSLDLINKTIIGGSLTNYPASKDSQNRLLLRPVELSQNMKEIDMAKTLEELFGDLKTSITEAINGKPDAPVTPSAPVELAEGVNPSIQELLKTPDAIEEMGKRAVELAQAAIKAGERKQHIVQFAASVAGGTKEKPFGLKVKPDRIVRLLLSLPEAQAKEVEAILSANLDAAIDFAQHGFESNGFPIKPEIPGDYKAAARIWVEAGHKIEKWFDQYKELGSPADYNLAEFTMVKES